MHFNSQTIAMVSRNVVGYLRVYRHVATKFVRPPVSRYAKACCNPMRSFMRKDPIKKQILSLGVISLRDIRVNGGNTAELLIMAAW